jgi:predicted ArsR family transcriptional regulator
MKQILWYLIAGTRGGMTRGMIIDLLRKKPLNANKIAEKLDLDYKTARHHLDVLQKNSVLHAVGENYGAVYFFTDQMEEDMATFDDIWKRFGKDLGKDS